VKIKLTVRHKQMRIMFCWNAILRDIDRIYLLPFWYYKMWVQLIICWVFWFQFQHLMTVQQIAIEPLQQRSCLALLLLRIWQVFVAFLHLSALDW